MHQNTSNYNSNIHFRPPGLLGGPWGEVFFAGPFFSEAGGKSGLPLPKIVMNAKKLW